MSSISVCLESRVQGSGWGGHGDQQVMKLQGLQGYNMKALDDRLRSLGIMT